MTMICLTPEVDMPMPDNDEFDRFVPTLKAAAATARLLAEAGLTFAPTDADLDYAAGITRQAAQEPGELMLKAAALGLLKQTPAALLLTEHILQEFGHKVVQEAQQVRFLVTNKLVVETENPDPRVRLRALELLGKIGDVGLFNEKREVTVTHQTTDDVKDRLRAKLQQLLTVEDADFIDDEPEEPEEEDYDE